MNDFWAKRLAPPQTQQRVVPTQTASSVQNPWWLPLPVQQPQPQQTVQQPVQHQQQPVQPNSQGQVPIEMLLANPNYVPSKPPISDRLADYCPSCNSGNYMHIAGLEKMAKRCFDCGYNPMFQHSTAGMSAPSQAGAPVRPMRVQTGGQSNVNMTPFAHVA